jgi:hypothetical protein
VLGNRRRNSPTGETAVAVAAMRSERETHYEKHCWLQPSPEMDDLTSATRARPQKGYAAFTCARQDLDGIIEYIKGQEEHHRRRTFAEEYRELLIEAGVEFDERYLPR